MNHRARCILVVLGLFLTLATVPAANAQAGSITLASAAWDGTWSNSGASFERSAQSVSANGRYVAFQSTATNLVQYHSGTWTDIFVRDVWAGATELASQSTAGVQGNEHAYDASISADGSFVVFDSVATSLVAGHTGTYRDIFLRGSASRDYGAGVNVFSRGTGQQ